MALPPIQAIDLTSLAAFADALESVETVEEARLLERLTRMSWVGAVFAGSDVWLGSSWTAGWYDETTEARMRAAAASAAEVLGELERRGRELAGGVGHAGRGSPRLAGGGNQPVGSGVLEGERGEGSDDAQRGVD